MSAAGTPPTYTIDGSAMTSTEIADEFGSQLPNPIANPTPEVANLALAAGTADDTCTITLTLPQLGKDVAAGDTIVMTGNFATNPVQWATVATLAKTTGTGPATKKAIDDWR